MRRRVLAGPIVAAAATMAVGLTGCGGNARQTSSAAPGTSTTSTAPGTSTTSTAPSTTSTAPGPPAPPGGRLTVAPAVGRPGTTMRFTLVAPRASGRHGQVQLSYVLTVGGPVRAGCVAQHSSAVAVPGAGQPVTVAVAPAQLGGRWCAGDYTARVTELARPVCTPTQACPQFIRVVAVFGPVRFRITA